jgi:hemerythrin-like domain-containing protein
MATRRTRTSAETGAIGMLMSDHKKVQKMFRDFEKVKEQDQERSNQIVKTAVAALKIHTTLEEELFYPEARRLLSAKSGEEESLVDEAEVEHKAAKTLISELEGMQPDDPHYAASFTVLGEYVKHHISEEEKQMFPKLKRAKLDVEELGHQMMERKQQLMSEMGIEEEAEAEMEEQRPARRRRPTEARRGASHSRGHH